MRPLPRQVPRLAQPEQAQAEFPQNGGRGRIRGASHRPEAAGPRAEADQLRNLQLHTVAGGVGEDDVRPAHNIGRQQELGCELGQHGRLVHVNTGPDQEFTQIGP